MLSQGRLKAEWEGGARASHALPASAVAHPCPFSPAFAPARTTHAPNVDSPRMTILDDA